MTDLLPWLIANWPLVALIAAIALVLLILLVVVIAFAVSWYFWRWVIQAHDEPDPWQEYITGGDFPHLPDGYWQAVARKEAKGRAG